VLVELLNDILDLSKFDAGQLELERIPFDLGSLVEDTANLLSQNAAPSVELTCLIDPQFPAQVLGDPTRVSRSSATCCPTPQVHPLRRVDVRLSPRTAGRIEVCDTGIGAGSPGENLPAVHPGWCRYHPAIWRHRTGPGADLQPLRSHAGRLSISSEVGFGSQFCADLPLPMHSPAHRQPPLKVR
jgi:hypothetical protein